MPVPDIEKIIRENLRKLNRLKDRELPIKVGRAVVESTRQNFRDGGFYGRKWKDTKRQQVGFYGVAGQNGPLNSGNDHLMSSTNCIPGKGKVTIFNPLEYAEIHNKGGQIPVTAKMKGFLDKVQRDKESERKRQDKAESRRVCRGSRVLERHGPEKGREQNPDSEAAVHG